jgi:N-acylneuraminate cytidylyltransferase
MKVLFLIPARAGSKRIPGKNSKLMNGKPLISYSIETALKFAPAEDICISTDDKEIIRIAEKHGLKIPFIRPAYLATDQSSSNDVIKHAIDHYESKNIYYDSVILLQPTSPFRKDYHVMELMDQLEQDKAVEMVVSVKVTSSNPYYVLFEENDEGYLKRSKASNFTRFQDCPEVYEVNGSIYGIRVEAMKNYGSLFSFRRIKKYVMEDLYSVDIDTPLDWSFCEFLVEKGLIDLG